MLSFGPVPARQAEPSVIEISRGARGDFEVADTTLYSGEPDRSFGGDQTLAGGPQKAILIRFGALRRAVAANQPILEASLRLTLAGGGPAKLASVSVVKVPWGEGPGNSLRSALSAPGKVVAPLLAATWRERRGQRAPWQRAGASGAGDAVVIPNVKFQADADTLTLTGLEKAVAEMRDRPEENYGFLLNFETAVEFSSSEASRGRPVLTVKVGPSVASAGADLAVESIVRTAPDTITATIVNVGDAPSSAFSTVWSVDERVGAIRDGGKSLPAGGSTTVTLQDSGTTQPDGRLHPVTLSITPETPDVNPTNNAATFQASGQTLSVALSPEFAAAVGVRPATWLSNLAHELNDSVFPYSRFSFAPEGTIARVNLVLATAGADLTLGLRPGMSPREAAIRQILTAMGAPDFAAQNAEFKTPDGRILPTDVFAGLSGYGDTRNESSLPGSLALPHAPFSSPIFDVNPLAPSGLLSSTDVAAMNARLAGMTPTVPKTSLLRVQDLAGRPIAAQELGFYPVVDGKVAEEAAFKVSSGTTGTVLLPAQDATGPLWGDGRPTTYAIRAVRFGVTDWTMLKKWQLLDAARRGTGAAFFELRFNLPGSALDSAVNLTSGKLPNDLAGSLPIELQKATDGNPATALKLGGEKSWVEIDLGKDRTLGEIRIAAGASFWDKFDIVGYGTGQTAADGTLLAREIDWSWTNRLRNEGGSVPYRGFIARVRYIRLVNRGSKTGELAEIAAIPALLNN
jgi:hypothetical protein